MASKSAKKSVKKNIKKQSALSPAVIVAIVVLVIAVAAIVVAVVGLNKQEKTPEDTSKVVSEVSEESGARTRVAPLDGEPTGYGENLAPIDYKDDCSYVQIEMDDGGKIVVELYPDIAPITVENFVSLVEDGFYDGITFHRIENRGTTKNFVIQGGDPKGNGQGGSGKNIFGEFTINGFENNLSHDRGVISMARASGDYNSASSQFFFCLSGDYKDALDGQYASFGKVVQGMDVIDTIAHVATAGSTPLSPVVMKEVTVLKKAEAKE